MKIRKNHQRMNAREALPLFGITVTAFIFNTSEFMPVALLTDIAASFAVSEAQAGMLISVYAWMVMALSLPLMMAASRLEFKRLLLLVVLIFALGQFLSAIATSYFMLMGARIVVACAHAIFWSIASPMAIRVVSEDHRRSAMGIVVMGSSVALIAGLPLGRVVGLVLGWRMTFACVAALSVIALAYLYWALPRIPATEPFSPRGLPRLLRNGALRNLYIFVALMMTGYYICYSYIEPYMLQVVGMDEMMVTFVISAFGIAGIVGSILFSKFYVALRLKFFMVSCACIVVGLLALVLAPQGVLVAFAVCMFLGLFATALNVAMQSEVIRNTRLDDQAVATSIYSGIFNLGIGSGSALGGSVVNAVGIGYIGIAGGILAAVALVFCAVRLLPCLRGSAR